MFYLNTVNFRNILVNMMTNYLPVKLESVYKIPYLIKLCQIVELKRGSFEINKNCHFFQNASGQFFVQKP